MKQYRQFKLFIKRSSQSAPAFYLSLKKPPTVNKRFGPPLKCVLITVSVIAFIIAVILDVKIRWFDCQVAVCVNKRALVWNIPKELG